MRMGIHIERWPTIRPFRITGRVYDYFESIVVEVEEHGVIGRGEALGVHYLGETVERLVAQVEQIRKLVEMGIGRLALQSLLPPGGARNAIDSALWDLEAKSSGRSIWELTDISPKRLETVFTIGIEETPEEMAEKAASAAAYGFLKIKLDAFQSTERLMAIRHSRPDAQLVVDANQGWTFAQLVDLAPTFAKLGVQMIEQPLGRGSDHDLEGYDSPVPLCADESCLHVAELEQTALRYDWINIKLDKAGGLTHALELAQAARNLGLRVMVGSMGGSSLAMAPAFVVGCLADLVDIDGPLLQQSDRVAGLCYDGGWASVFSRTFWG